jgi:predicted amidohydrolase
MRIAALQSDIVWEDPEANYRRIEPWVKTAAAAEARLLVLPELFACGFTMNTASVEEPPGGPSTQFLQEQARQHGMWICGSVAERREGATRPYNTLILTDPTGALTRYDKIHPFSLAREHEHYEAGSEFATVAVEGLRCTFFVCYDLRFADEFWATARKTDAYVVVANWPERRRHHWRVLLQARAIENQAYVIGINRVGRGGGLDYCGDSQIIDPWGETLTSGAKEETLLLAEVVPEVVRAARENLPFLPDRR